MNNNIENNLNQENNQNTQNNIPGVQPIQLTPAAQPAQVTEVVQPTPAAQPAQVTEAVQPTPAAQPAQVAEAVQPTPAAQQIQQDIIVEAPPEPTGTVTQTEHPKEKKNNKKLIIILIIIIIAVGVGLILFLNKDKFSNKSTNKNEQTENTNNETTNNTNNNNSNTDTNNNTDNNQQLENAKQEAFIDTAKSYANMAKTLWSADAISCHNIVSSAVEDGDYYIMIDTRESVNEILPILSEPKIKSPWDNNDIQGYVRVNIETIGNNRTPKFYISLTDGTHTISDDNTLISDEIQTENITMTTDLELLNKVKMTTDFTDENGNYTSTADCTFDSTNNKYTCANFTGYGPEAVDKIKAICIES